MRRPSHADKDAPRQGWLSALSARLQGRQRLLLCVACVVGAVLLAAVIVLVRVRGAVLEALEAPAVERAPVEWSALRPPSLVPAHWVGGSVNAVVLTREGLVVAGDFGAADDARSWGLTCGMPSVRVVAATSWRGTAVLGLAAGGVLRLWDGGCEEMRSGFGTLHVRAFHETEAGELVLCAREGLFRWWWSASEIERLSHQSTRAAASTASALLVGSEEGLYRVAPTGLVPVASPDPWIEQLAIDGDRLVAVTATGLVWGPIDGPLHPVRGGEDIIQAVVHRGELLGVVDPPRATIRRLDASTGQLHEVHVPQPVLRVLSAGGELFAETPHGLLRRTSSGWNRFRARPEEALPAGPVHMTALAATGSRLVAGIFDGGLLTGSAGPRGRLKWRAVRGGAAWAVNALLNAGGAVWVASLRGVARLEGDELQAVPNVRGSAFALLATPDGLVIGQGVGVRLPDGHMLSAFHGLPGNQATALARENDLVFVGTRSGLGALRGQRVAWSVHPGEGRLPHPWITALAHRHDGLFVGTYGGGLARRKPSRNEGGDDPGIFETYVETEGLRVNPGCLVASDSDVFAGTEAQGLWQLSRDGARFNRLDVPLPGKRVTALAWQGDALLVGTDEGLARLEPTDWQISPRRVSP